MAINLDRLNSEEAYNCLIRNDYNWYIVEYIDGTFDLKHNNALEAILECGHDPERYDMSALHQCWNGQELGECPW